ncbi:MAG: shikimate kinase AroK [Gammaproteobacteria bacterium]|nr:shikimate kinase AroK [Gammaproteobacteria bacterium]
MEKPARIFLIGPMGAGKTTIGKRLARALKRRFVDCDHEIERRTGARIPLIFEIEGESGFRSREKRVIDDLTQEESIVLATGGGAVLDPENRIALANRGLVVYLNAPIELLVARTRNDANRPLLQVPNRNEKMREIIRQREPLYREIAHLTIDTGAQSMSDIVNTIRASAS